MRQLNFGLILLIIFLCLAQFSIAQPVPPNCPPSYSAGFNITGDSISYCGDGVNLTANGFSTIFATDSYAVNQIPYNPYPWVGGNSILTGIDDCWSAIVPLPFPFCFFGQKYNNVVIGANGQVSFDIVNTQPPLVPGSNPWASSGLFAPTGPTANVAMDNCIMTPYHDIDPGSFPIPNTKTTWDTFGVAPCRYMVISYDSIPMFSCSTLYASHQVVLFESTYLIDVNIKNKPLCGSWNGGVAHEGIQNITGTTAFMVPGRNGSQWTATNDSYRFSPAGQNPSNFLYTWKDAITGVVLGTGPTLNYFPLVSTKVTVEGFSITDCDTIPALLADTIDIIVTGVVVANFITDIHLGCTEDTVIFTNTTVSSLGVPDFIWSFGDGFNSTAINPTHIYANQDTFRVRLIGEKLGCIDTIEKVIDLRHPINAAFVALGPIPTDPLFPPKDSVCLGQGFQATSASTPAGFVAHSYDWGDGTPLDIVKDPIHTYANPGTYTITLVITDTLGCKDTFTQLVYVIIPSFVSYTISDSLMCEGEPVFFKDSLSANTHDFTWDFGDGQIIKNIHNPTHSWDNPIGSPFTITLTGETPRCPNAVFSKTITVEPYPKVNLGPDTMICPGLTGSIVLTDISNSSSPPYVWSSGETSSSITITQPGRYWLQTSSPTAGCTTTDSIWVKRDCYLNIPNSFSPNGDGLNDYFLPRELLSSGLSSFTMNIYNRWGENIFTTNKIDGRGWDGKYNNVNQPVGVYVYVIDARFINNVRKEYKGNVTLLR